MFDVICHNRQVVACLFVSWLYGCTPSIAGLCPATPAAGLRFSEASPYYLRRVKLEPCLQSVRIPEYIFNLVTVRHSTRITDWELAATLYSSIARLYPHSSLLKDSQLVGYMPSS